MRPQHLFNTAAARGATALGLIFLAGATPASQPALQPAEAPADAQVTAPAAGSIDRWFSALADGDPEARRQARQNLMGLHRDDLPALKSIVHDNQPILPGQRS